LITTNNFFLYQGKDREAVKQAGAYHSTIYENNYRYRDMMNLLKKYKFENMKIDNLVKSQSNLTY